jgi:hypothetical protein
MIAFDRVTERRSTPVTSISKPVVSLTSDELTSVLLRMGGRLVARQMHGNFVSIRYHLVFVRSAAVVGQRDLFDVLRAAAMTPSRLRELLEESRRAPSAPPSASAEWEAVVTPPETPRR